MSAIINTPIGTLRTVKNFPMSYELVQNTQDVAATLSYVGAIPEKERIGLPFGFLLVLMETDANGDSVGYAEVWGGEGSVPYLESQVELVFNGWPTPPTGGQ